MQNVSPWLLYWSNRRGTKNQLWIWNMNRRRFESSWTEGRSVVQFSSISRCNCVKEFGTTQTIYRYFIYKSRELPIIRYILIIDTTWPTGIDVCRSFYDFKRWKLSTSISWAKYLLSFFAALVACKNIDMQNFVLQTQTQSSLAPFSIYSANKSPGW